MLIIRKGTLVHPLWIQFRLRQAAMQSANIDSCQSGAESDSKSKREVLDSKKSESPRFENFQQFKEYKQKMRDQGLENESIIVSIPNTTGKFSIQNQGSPNQAVRSEIFKLNFS